MIVILDLSYVYMSSSHAMPRSGSHLNRLVELGYSKITRPIFP